MGLETYMYNIMAGLPHLQKPRKPGCQKGSFVKWQCDVMRGDAVDFPMGSEIEKEEKKALSRFCTLGQVTN